jgi:biotin--protein ligase
VLESSSEASSSRRTLDHIYYNGGGHFVLPPISSNVQILARYGQTKSSSSESPIAAVLTKNGKGKAVLCSVHFEYPLTDSPARDAISKFDTPPTSESIAESERARIEWAGEILQMLGLQPPGKRKDDDEVLQGNEVPSLLLHPTHPSPIFVFSHPSLPDLGSKIFAAKAIHDKLRPGDDGFMVLRDANDELRICTSSTVASTSSDTLESGVTTYLSNARRTPPTSELLIADLQLDDMKNLPPPVDFNSMPKTILSPDKGLVYTPRWTPLFNFNTFWTGIDAARKRSGRKSGVMRRDNDNVDKVALGDLLFYAETVTSTQIMLDKLVQSSLPIARLTMLQKSSPFIQPSRSSRVFSNVSALWSRAWIQYMAFSVRLSPILFTAGSATSTIFKIGLHPVFDGFGRL